MQTSDHLHGAFPDSVFLKVGTGRQLKVCRSPDLFALPGDPMLQLPLVLWQISYKSYLLGESFQSPAVE